MQLHKYKEAEIQHQYNLKRDAKIRKAGFLAVGATAVASSLLVLSAQPQMAQFENTIAFSSLVIMLVGCGKYLNQLMSGLNPKDRPKTSSPVLGMPFEYSRLTPHEKGLIVQEQFDDKDNSIHSIKNIREKFLKAYEPKLEEYKTADVNTLRSAR
jgi:hypothetical protein